jgi:geranylgeranyl diphosphate/geranylgeranyl-bacteriochlorophyllide a reductase
MKFSLVTISFFAVSASAFTVLSTFVGKPKVRSTTVSSSSTMLEMKYKVAVVGGGPSGACAAEIFAQEKNIDTVFFERKMDNAKPCGGAIPLCMVGEFDLPESVVDRKVRSKKTKNLQKYKPRYRLLSQHT